jgi:Uma2 family endonuclease
MATVARALTYEDLCRAREDGNRYELIEGELVLVAAPSPLHQRFLVWLTVRFVRLVEEAGLGEVYVAPVDVHLADGSYVQPDLLVVLADRAGIVDAALIEGEPSLLVEVVSRSSRARDRQQKASLYARVGVPEYWTVDSDDQSITVHADPRDGRYRTVRRETGIVRAETVPGLAVDLGEFFARERTRG